MHLRVDPNRQPPNSGPSPHSQAQQNPRPASCLQNRCQRGLVSVIAGTSPFSSQGLVIASAIGQFHL